MLLIITSIILITLIIRIIYTLVIRPYLLVRFYRKQGLDMYFQPGMGFLAREQQHETELGDCLYQSRTLMSQCPSKHAWGGNAAEKVFLHFFDPALVKLICQQQSKYYIKDPTIYGLLQVVGGEEGLVFSEGNQWKKHRKIISSAFHFEFLKDMVPTIYESAMEQMQLMAKNGETTAIEDFANITGNVVGKVFFGSNFNEHIIDGLPATIYLKELGIKTMEINLTPPVVLFGPRFVLKGLLPSHRAYLAKVKKYMDMSHDLIEGRRNFIKKEIDATGNFNPAKKSLLDNLILNSMEDPKEGMSNKEICDEFTTFCFAGMDTTGQLVYMTSYHLHENPKILEKVRQEAERYLNGPDITAETLNKMEYTHAVLQESLRMTGPGSMLLYRESLEDHMLGNIMVKKRTVICVDNVAMHFCPDYHEEPQKFMPERWLDPNSKTRKSIAQEPYVYIPFSAGQRNCIGQHLALMEAKIILGLFVKMFDFRMRDGYKMRYVRRFMYEPEERIKYKLSLRD